MAAVAFVFGAVWGSFLNVCIYRVPVGKSIVFPGSHCTVCGTPIQWFDNIPILSYLLLSGTCRSCGSHFSARYAAIEALSGLLFVAIWLTYPWQFAVISHWVVLCLLLIGMFTDIDHFIIPDGVTLGGLGFAILSQAMIPTKESFCSQDMRMILNILGIPAAMPNDGFVAHAATLGWSVISAGFGWMVLSGIALFGRILFKKEAMGGGDIKLFAFLGAYFGVSATMAILFLASVLGALGGSLLLLAHKLRRRDQVDELSFDPAAAKRPPYAVGVHKSDTCAILGSLQGETESAPPRFIRISLKTSRQLHHFPFGPYIAIAAIFVLIIFQQYKSHVEEYLWLVPELTGK
ncbi:MAG: prepilin peptidase [Candidatus Sumerlaeaceae bacterium]